MNSHLLMALGRHDGGAVVEAGDELLSNIIAAVRETGKAGKLTLEIDVKPNGEKAFELGMGVKAKLPTTQFGRAFYFADQHNQLSRDNQDHQFEFDETGVTPLHKGS